MTTSVVLQSPNAVPTANQIMSYPAPTSNVSQFAWITPGGTCTNQFVTVISAVLVPTCASVNLATMVTGTLPAANIGVVASVFNSGTITIPSGNSILVGCTSTCSVPVPVPAAGYQICVKNDAGVSTAITLSALGSSAMYPKADDSGYGTAGTGTMVSTAAAGSKVCLFGRDSTHYELGAVSNSANWTVN